MATQKRQKFDYVNFVKIFVAAGASFIIAISNKTKRTLSADKILFVKAFDSVTDDDSHKQFLCAGQLTGDGRC